MNRSPDLCTSLAGLCGKPSLCQDCSHALWYGKTTINGKEWQWELNPRFGPLFLRKDGEPKVNQPGERHPVWKAFEKWLNVSFQAYKDTYVVSFCPNGHVFSEKR